jgi:hypothetical protein
MSPAQLVHLLRVTVVAGVLIVALGAAAVIAGVFDPDDAERARGFVSREYEAELGDCEHVRDQRLVCEIERPTPQLRRALGRGEGSRICLYVFDNASVVLDGYAPC